MQDLTTGKTGKLIFYFALPMLIGNVFQQLYGVIDSVVVGHYIGKTALAAIGASFPLLFLLISMIIGISSGFSVIIAQYFGAKETEKVKLSIDTMYWVLFVSAILVTIIGLLTGGMILRFTRLPKEVLPEAIIFFNIFISGSIFMFGFNGTASILRGLGDSKTPLYFLAASTVLNIILDLIFIPIFKWGIAGAAYATVISQALAYISTLLYLNKTHPLVVIKFNSLPRFDKTIFMQSIRIGLPSGFQQTFVALGMLALYGIVNIHGTSVTAAYSVAGRIDSFAMLPAMNFSMALAAFAGQNIGAGNFQRVKRGMLATFYMTAAISVFFSLVSIFLGKYLMHLFTDDAEVIRIGYEYLVIVSLFYILFSTMFIINGTLRGAGDTLVPMFITLFALWAVRVPASYILSHYFGVSGIWWGIPAGWAVGLTASYLYFLTGKWKTKSVVKKKPLIQLIEE